MRILTKSSASLLALALLLGFSASVRANVYATNIKFNGALSTVATTSNQSLTISYVLNEPATAGVTVTILSGGSVIRTLPGGTNTGVNSVTWNLKDSGGNPVPLGAYSVNITAAATGYEAWTQISHDTNASTYVYYPEGLAVNKNTNSPYYGRVFVGNAMEGTPTSIPGNNDTILKFNADGSFADDGPDGDGGYPIQDNGFGSLPYKLRLGGDDRLYMLDWSGSGEVAAFDMRLTTNQVILTPQNYLNNPYWPNPLNYGNGWSSMDVTDAGTTNARVWLGDDDMDPGAGIWYWPLVNGAVSANNTTGTLAVAAGGPMSQDFGGLMVDTNFNVYVGQGLTSSGGNECLKFINIPTTNSTAWTVSGALDINDTTIDSRQSPKYVAFALDGPSANGILLLNPTTGATITTLDSTNEYAVTAWDNVGNLYAASGSTNRWRVFSPPDGPNQATTSAAFTIQLVTAVTITSVVNNNGTVIITFTAGSSDNPGNFTLLSAPAVQGPYSAVAGATITSTSPGDFTATAPASGTNTFYVISRAPGS